MTVTEQLVTGATDPTLHGQDPAGLTITTNEYVNGQVVVQERTADFPYDDPWSFHTRRTIAGIAATGEFTGKTVFEAGSGDARNAKAAGIHDPESGMRYVGVDVDGWRVDVAKGNLRALGVPDERFEVQKGDAVEWLAKNADDSALTGWGIACLPQAPQGEATTSHADGYDPDLPSLHAVDGLEIDGLPVDAYGLKLNAAFLDTLRRKVDPTDFSLLLTISDRVPPAILEQLFDATGWEVEDAFHTDPEDPIQQDPDTSVAYVEAFDDIVTHGPRFYEYTDAGDLAAISAAEAEARRIQSLADANGDTDLARRNLNVYHGLNVLHLQPK